LRQERWRKNINSAEIEKREWARRTVMAQKAHADEKMHLLSQENGANDVQVAKNYHKQHYHDLLATAMHGRSQRST